jgi:RsiW-degrading membrane proteinase PrsW (M82 family)
VEDRAIAWIGGGRAPAAQIAAIAAGVEELARLAIVLALACGLPRHFNDPMDGLVYGSLAAIGMALEETTVAVARESTLPLGEVLPVEIVRLFGHTVMGGITGFGVGMVRRHGRGRSWIWIAAGSMLAGMAIHFLWDYVALAGAMYVGAETWTVPASIALMAVSIVLYGVLVILGSRSSRAVFDPKSSARVWRRAGRQ